MDIEVLWPTAASADELLPGVAEVTRAVSATGGAVGWLTELTRAQSDAWFCDLLDRRVRLVVARLAGRVVGLGRWERWEKDVLSRNADIRQVMTHPDARGHGVARAVMVALIDDATAAGVETLTMDVRGNNHGAVRLYASLGFAEYGRNPDFIAVGPHRFDRVLLARRVGTPEGVFSHGGRAEGPGASS